MNKFLVFVLTVVLALSLIGCDTDSSDLCLNTGAGLAEYCGE